MLWPHFPQIKSLLIPLSLLACHFIERSSVDVCDFLSNFSLKRSKSFSNFASISSRRTKFSSKCKHCSSRKSSIGDEGLDHLGFTSFPASSLTDHWNLRAVSRCLVVLLPDALLKLLQGGDVNDEAGSDAIDRGSENFLKSLGGGDKSCTPSLMSKSLLMNENRMAGFGSESRFSGNAVKKASEHRFLASKAKLLEFSIVLFSSMLFKLDWKDKDGGISGWGDGDSREKNSKLALCQKNRQKFKFELSSELFFKLSVSVRNSR